MLLRYFQLAFRNLLKHKTFSFISIGGLGLSLASCIFILYYIHDEISYDRFHTQSEKIFRITQTFTTPENVQNIRFTHQKLGPYLQRTYPHVVSYVRFQDANVKFGKNQVVEKGVFKADASVFDIFTLPLLKGNQRTALKHPNSMVISKSLAEKYFHGDAMGESIDVDGISFVITGVMQDMPRNSDKWISALLSVDMAGEESASLQFMFDTYVLLQQKEDRSFISKVLSEVSGVFHTDQTEQLKYGYDMQALTELHFFNDVEMDNPKGNIINVIALGVVAVVILVVSVLNFINLTTIRSLERSKEVGIRKVNGAKRGELIRQFLCESLLSVLLASVIALGLIQFIRHFFESVSGKTILFSNLNDVWVVMAILLLLIALVLVSAFYPAWILSSHQSIQVIRNSPSSSKNPVSRKILTTLQFAISTSLLVFLVTLLAQMDFMMNTNLGFSKEQVVVLRMPNDRRIVNSIGAIKEEFLKIDGVDGVSVGGFASTPGTSEPAASPIWTHANGSEREIIASNIYVDKDYPELLQLKMKEGHSFRSINTASGGGLAIVNESFVAFAGWKNPVGEKVRTYGGTATVIGVINDFHFKSLHSKIEPMVMIEMSSEAPDVRSLFIRTSVDQLDAMRSVWRKLAPDHEFDYFFLDQSFEEQYSSETNLQTLFIYFTFLAILIAASGLLGLTMYHVDLKAKEVGIRKVFGAGTSQLIQMLSRGFIATTLLGAIVGSVLGTMGSIYWLESFAYRIRMDALLVLTPVLIVMAISFAIVIYKTYRGSMKNVSEVLRQ